MAKRPDAKTQNREMLAQVAKGQAQQMAMMQQVMHRVGVLERWSEALERTVARIAPERFEEMLGEELAAFGLERKKVEPRGPAEIAGQMIADELAPDDLGAGRDFELSAESAAMVQGLNPADGDE